MTRLPLAALATAAVLAGLSACATVAGAVGKSWSTALVGNQEVPGPGDPDGTGTAKVTADATTDTVCVDIGVRAISRPTAAHIHRGRRGEAGPPVLTLPAPVNGAAKQCLRVEKALAAAIIADPAGYYVNIHTADYPAGAIRGQLAAGR
ncbi:CHRD domain-containing protein [Sphingomonas gilva]|uniref:CHRD domain-containing protein n=1 Tax=Sphingomonas gilva TaxID=2305907 RepID=A0A396S404_9SPHN|nr:CHRD domain-containing protein [Sphingomonas gilva]RHW18145.1 CHRD domain-containing protein [Sphingomonas gilva]